MTLWIIPESDREEGDSLSDLAPKWYTQYIMRLPQMKSRPLRLRSLLGDLQV